MALGHYIKSEMVKVFREKIDHSQAIILCSAKGLKAMEMDELREKINKEKADISLLKRKLALRAFQKKELDVEPFLEGDTFYAFSREGLVGISKILIDFSKDHDALKIKGGIVDKKIIDVGEIKRYASLPSKEILIKQLIFNINAPIQSLILVLQAPLRKLSLTLKAVIQIQTKKT